MRYQIGEKVTLIRQRMSKYGVVWLDIVQNAPIKIDLIQTTVSERYDEPCDRDPTGLEKYDGFVLNDNVGRIFISYFPSMSSDKETDEANMLFAQANASDEEPFEVLMDVKHYIRLIRQKAEKSPTQGFLEMYGSPTDKLLDHCKVVEGLIEQVGKSTE